jgi:outer membrane protein
MNRHILAVAFGLFGLAAVGSVYAQDLKIAYVNMAKAIETSPQAEAVLKKLKAEFDPKDQKLTAQREKLREIESELEKNALVLKDSDRQRLEKEVRDLRRVIKRDTEAFREELNVRQNEELRRLERIVLNVVAKFAEEGKYDLIIHQGAIYASNRIDITEKILAELAKTDVSAE